jgi:hypothetical protein
MTPTTKALICAVTAITETLPEPHRQCVNDIPRETITGKLVDNKTARVIERMIDDPRLRER